METQDQDIMVGVNPKLYQRLEKAAAQNNLSLREYLEEVLERVTSHELKASQREPRPMTRETYESILQLREQIKQDRQGRPFDDSTDIIRQMREERVQYLADL